MGAAEATPFVFRGQPGEAIHGPIMAGGDLYGLALIAIAAWVFLIFFMVGRTFGHRPTPRRWRPYRNPPGSYRNFPDARPRARPNLKDLRQPAGPDLADPMQQLRAVEATQFNKRPLLSRAEYRVFKVIEDDVATARRGYRVFAQTTLGEVLWSPNEDAFHAINSKRVDILIVDQGGWPVAAVEYQGAGHYQDAAAARDAVKKEALRKAGVRYIEVFANDSPEEIRLRLRKRLGWEAADLTALEARGTG